MPCGLRDNQPAINYDGTAALCCGVYEPEHFLGNFLDIPYQELQELKHSNPMCTTCTKHGLHLSGVYGEGTPAVERLNDVAQSRVQESRRDPWAE